MIYKFNFDGKEYELKEDNLDYFINDEEFELEGIDANKVLELLSNSKEVEFERAYYETCCEECRAGKAEKKKVFDFLEFFFYAYAKDGKFITSSIDDDYEGKSFTKLYREGKVDCNYIVTVIVCKNCGTYSIEIEEFEL
ncbi:DUF3785 family protein [Clostridium chauvoei]|uniref:DUF3785 domain-containing protein n=2 Tax=Clostridium chauvoei TaxID=46867 RepID=S6EIT2_9CLOT|nr:DUF3785 family protein [Clostridium chauvoei]MBX7281051.1 DUF3785 domain-containing protein [Clostridium chauvoei]MBX7283562.1 DUF3785 domain-containing protein [Clostridium chauvoei]MBX7286024.1 DUF3785 domain-containing protein [Clostridium chauvoei]MBX7288538.1 DUF3785 domain-containing protein [Clostridium chauvoei]MBX7291137.1 DUF3785 domain-containing protein [Clostridium chauvoei]